MACTIGSLVQGITNHRRWLSATSIYIIACTTTSVLLGIVLSIGGQLLRLYARATFPQAVLHWLSPLAMALFCLVSVAYALSDLEVITLPRPRLMHAVPLNWWRWWQPYGGALAYGAALGIGITTEIYFGAFYAVCLWCIVRGNLVYGALLMGTYGFIRAVTLIPATHTLYKRSATVQQGIRYLLHLQETARLMMALLLVLFCACLIGFLLSS